MNSAEKPPPLPFTFPLSESSHCPGYSMILWECRRLPVGRIASSETPRPKIGIWGGCIGNDSFPSPPRPRNDNIQHHIRNEIEALIFIFQYRMAPILKLTYKFSIHLILDLLLLSKMHIERMNHGNSMRRNQVHFSNMSSSHAARAHFLGTQQTFPRCTGPSRHSSSQGAAGGPRKTCSR